MKKVLQTIVLLLFLGVSAWGQGSGGLYFKGTQSEAMDHAYGTGRLLLIEFYAPWSHQSRWNNTKTLTDESVKSLLASKFVVLQVDVQTPQGAALASRYEVTGYPNMVIFSAYGNPVLRVDKNLESSDFISLLNDVLRSQGFSLSGGQVKSLLYAIQLGNPNVEDLMSELLRGKSPINVTQDDIWQFFENSSTMYYGSVAYAYVIDNQKRLQLIVGDKKIEDILVKTHREALVPMVVGSKEFDSVLLAQALRHDKEDLNIYGSLAQARARGDVDTFIGSLELLFGTELEESDRFSMALSLSMVVENGGTVSQRKRAMKIVNLVSQSTISPSKKRLLDGLKESLGGYGKAQN